MGNYRWSLLELRENIRDTLETDKDFIVLIDGETGAGKSTLGLKLAKKVCPWFDIVKDIIYSREELVDRITNARRGSALLVDEAINVLFRRDFASKKQKFLLKLLDMCRDRNLLLIMCVPNFWSLDNHLLSGRAKLRIYVGQTGLALMWKPSKNPFAQDKWYRKENEKITGQWDIYHNARKTKGFLGYLHFGDLGAEEKRIYIDIKTRKKQEVKEAEEKEESKEKEVSYESFIIGRMETIIWLDTRRLLKPGWKKAMAIEEGVTDNTIASRIKKYKYKRKNGEIEVPFLVTDKQYYNSLDNEQSSGIQQENAT